MLNNVHLRSLIENYNISQVVVVSNKEENYICDPECNFTFKLDARSAGYYAMGIAQESQSPVLLYLEGTLENISNLYAPMAEAYYQRVPILIWIDTTDSRDESVIHTLYKYCRYNVWLRSDSELNRINIIKACMYLKRDIQGPVLILDTIFNVDNTSIPLIEYVSDSTFILENHIEFLSSNQWLIVIAEGSNLTSSDKDAIMNFCDVSNSTILDESIVEFRSYYFNKIFPEDSLILIVGELSSLQKNRLFSLNRGKKNKIYQISSIDELDAISIPVKVLYDIGASDLFSFFSYHHSIGNDIQYNSVLKNIELNEFSSTIQNICSNIDEEIVVFGDYIYDVWVPSIIKYMPNMTQCFISKGKNTDGKLATFMGQIIGLKDKMNLGVFDVDTFCRDLNALSPRYTGNNFCIIIFGNTKNLLKFCEGWAKSVGISVEYYDCNKNYDDLFITPKVILVPIK